MMKKINIEKPTGFSLIEILIVVAMVTIIAGISFVSFKNIQPILELKGMTSELTNDLRYAQQLAVTEQIDHGIHIFPIEGKYQIIKYGSVQEILKEKLLPDKIDFSEVNGFTNNEAKFNAYGAAKEQGTIIILSVEDNSTTRIEVSPSGFVKNQ
ncbi:prepilin-type N-terminal cleavage/methylation domain-containing protein [Candidatus Parcubacteria bacterium]|nr:prepilin-type N-terminal cleavage/methylation domain-containing protein [Candidatus Parcubacteria bacterium]